MIIMNEIIALKRAQEYDDDMLPSLHECLTNTDCL